MLTFFTLLKAQLRVLHINGRSFINSEKNFPQPVHSAGCCLPAPLSSLHLVTSSHMGPGQGQPSGAHLFCITLQIMQKKRDEGGN